MVAIVMEKGFNNNRKTVNMKLKEYLIEFGVKQDVFGKLLGVSESTMLKIIKGGDMPLSIAEKIVKLTHKQVKIKDLSPLHPFTRPKKPGNKKNKTIS